MASSALSGPTLRTRSFYVEPFLLPSPDEMTAWPMTPREQAQVNRLSALNTRVKQAFLVGGTLDFRTPDRELVAALLAVDGAAPSGLPRRWTGSDPLAFWSRQVHNQITFAIESLERLPALLCSPSLPRLDATDRNDILGDLLMFKGLELMDVALAGVKPNALRWAAHHPGAMRMVMRMVMRTRSAIVTLLNDAFQEEEAWRDPMRYTSLQEPYAQASDPMVSLCAPGASQGLLGPLNPLMQAQVTLRLHFSLLMGHTMTLLSFVTDRPGAFQPLAQPYRPRSGAADRIMFPEIRSHLYFFQKKWEEDPVSTWLGDGLASVSKGCYLLAMILPDIQADESKRPLALEERLIAEADATHSRKAGAPIPLADMELEARGQSYSPSTTDSDPESSLFGSDYSTLDSALPQWADNRSGDTYESNGSVWTVDSPPDPPLKPDPIVAIKGGRHALLGLDLLALPDTLTRIYFDER